jgi:hypothetical protein
LLHGQFDENTTEADIAALVNDRHPGAASHRECAGMDRCWTLHESKETSQGHCGMGQATSALRDAVLDFLHTLG